MQDDFRKDPDDETFENTRDEKCATDEWPPQAFRLSPIGRHSGLGVVQSASTGANGWGMRLELLPGPGIQASFEGGLYQH